LTPESREAADLIAYLHRSRDELDRWQQQMTAERNTLEEERKKLRTEWVERQQKRIKELEAQFAEMQKRFHENVARVVEAVKERELRAQLEKTARRKMQDARAEAREELNTAVVQTISESQTDLGIHSGSLEAANADRLQAGAKIRVRGDFSPPGRLVRGNRSRAAAHESGTRRNHRHRDRRPTDRQSDCRAGACPAHFKRYGAFSIARIRRHRRDQRDWDDRRRGHGSPGQIPG